MALISLSKSFIDMEYFYLMWSKQGHNNGILFDRKINYDNNSRHKWVIENRMLGAFPHTHVDFIVEIGKYRLIPYYRWRYKNIVIT